MVRSPHHLSAPLPLKASHLIFPQHSPPPPADPLPSLLADSPSPPPPCQGRARRKLFAERTHLLAPSSVFLTTRSFYFRQTKCQTQETQEEELSTFFIDLATNVIYVLLQPECTYCISLIILIELKLEKKGDKKLKAQETRLTKAAAAATPTWCPAVKSAATFAASRENSSTSCRTLLVAIMFIFILLEQKNVFLLREILNCLDNSVCK